MTRLAISPCLQTGTPPEATTWGAKRARDERVFRRIRTPTLARAGATDESLNLRRRWSQRWNHRAFDRVGGTLSDHVRVGPLHDGKRPSGFRHLQSRSRMMKYLMLATISLPVAPSGTFALAHGSGMAGGMMGHGMQGCAADAGHEQRRGPTAQPTVAARTDGAASHRLCSLAHTLVPECVELFVRHAVV